jgi:quercetin dioxygenase-like cupin family protein
MAGGSMFYFNPEERKIKYLTEAIHARTFWGENMLLAVVDLEAGSILPVHSHPHEQCGYVITGELELTIGGETRILHPGEVYFIPGGIEHGARVVSPETAQVIDVFSPVRVDLQY